MRRTVAVGVLVVVVASVGVAQEALPWTIKTVYPMPADPTDRGGPAVRVALNPENGRPLVVFLDGNWEPAHERLTLRNVDASEGAAHEVMSSYSSSELADLDMDFYISPSEWKIGVSHRIVGTEALRFVEYVYDRTTSALSVNSAMVQDTTAFEYGHGTSVKYDSTGRPHIAAHVRPATLGLESLMYATYVGSGGNCGIGDDEGQWACQTVDSGDEVGRQPSLAIDDDDEPVIAYVALYGEVDLVFVARPTSTGAGSCGAGFWNCGYPDSDILANDQSQPAVFFDHGPAATGLHVAYLATSHYSTTQTTAHHAVWVGNGAGDASCSYPADWACEPYSSGTAVDPSSDLEMGVDAAGHAILSFASPGFAELMLVEDLGVINAGNCGSLDRMRCSVVDGDLWAETGEWLDLAVGVDGVPVVAYTRRDTNTLQVTLRAAYPWIFRDRFESADTGVWSATSP